MRRSYRFGTKRNQPGQLGAAIPEYALIIALVSLIALPALGFLGIGLRDRIDCQRNQLDGGGCTASSSSTSTSSTSSSSSGGS